MRAINDLSDVQIVLKSHDNFINSFNSQSIDRHGLKLVNNGNATDPQDYVTLSQIPSAVSTGSNTANQYYTIVFTQDGVINTGDVVPAFVAGYERTGLPIAVKMVCRTPPSGGDATVNIYIGPDLVSGQNILVEDLVFPAGGTAVVSSSNFITKVPYVGTNFVVYPVITAGNGAAIVTIEVVLKRSQNA